MNGNAGTLTGGKKSINHRALSVINRFPAFIGGDASHRIMGGGLDGQRVFHTINSNKIDTQLPDLRQAFHDARFPEVAQVEMNRALSVHTASGIDFALLGAGDDIARREFHPRRRIFFHEAFAFPVQQVPAFSPRSFRKQNSLAVQPGRMELHKLRIFNRDSRAVGGHGTIGGTGKGVGGDLEHAAISAGGHQHRFGLDHFHFPGTHIADHDTVAASVLHDQFVHEPFGIHLDGLAVFHHLLVQGMKDGVTGTVGGITGAGLGVSAKTALRDFSISGAAEHTTEMLKFVNDARSGFHIFFDGILVVEVVPALDGIEHVLFPTVVLGIPK